MMLKKALKPFLINNIKFIFIFLLIIFANIIRFVYLDKFPVGLDADQVEVVLSSKTINSLGVDSSGTSWYKSIFGNDTKAGIAALPSIVISPIIYFIDYSLLNSRIIFVLINILTIFFISLVAYELSKRKEVFIFALMVGSINPWLFVYSRLPTEAPFSLLMLFIGLYLFIKNNGKYILYSSIFFVVSFYSYFGSKPLIVLLIPLFVIGNFIFNNAKKNVKKYIYFLSLIIISIGFYLYVSNQNQSGTLQRRGTEEILILNIDKFNSITDEYRRSSINYPLKNMIFNKYSFALLEFTNKYVSWISSDFLFWKGDFRSMYTFGDHGMIYILDLIFLILGVAYLNDKKRIAFFVIVLALVAPIPTALSLNGNSFFYRGFLLIPVLIILISLGITFLYDQINNRFKNLYYFLLPVVYLILFTLFLLFYFFRYPIKQYENNYFPGRIISSYILRNNTSKIYIFTTSPYSIFNEYLYYSNVDSSVYKNLLNKEKDTYIVNNVTITNKCPSKMLDGVIILDSKLGCNLDYKKFLVLQNPSDSGVSFRIYFDKLCDDANLTSYQRDHLISDYNIESIDNSIFCNRWIQK